MGRLSDGLKATWNFASEAILSPPLAGATFTQALTGPVNEKTFLTYIGENYPADIAARIHSTGGRRK
jgi:hypothetical protein